MNNNAIGKALLHPKSARGGVPGRAAFECRLGGLQHVPLAHCCMSGPFTIARTVSHASEPRGERARVRAPDRSFGPARPLLQIMDTLARHRTPPNSAELYRAKPKSTKRGSKSRALFEPASRDLDRRLHMNCSTKSAVTFFAEPRAQFRILLIEKLFQRATHRVSARHERACAGMSKASGETLLLSPYQLTADTMVTATWFTVVAFAVSLSTSAARALPTERDDGSLSRRAEALCGLTVENSGSESC